MFAYAREHEPCIIFMDEIDAIGGRRFSEGTSADREIQRTLMEVSQSCSGRRLRVSGLGCCPEAFGYEHWVWVGLRDMRLRGGGNDAPMS